METVADRKIYLVTNKIKDFIANFESFLFLSNSSHSSQPWYKRNKYIALVSAIILVLSISPLRAAEQIEKQSSVGTDKSEDECSKYYKGYKDIKIGKFTEESFRDIQLNNRLNEGLLLNILDHLPITDRYYSMDSADRDEFIDLNQGESIFLVGSYQTQTTDFFPLKCYPIQSIKLFNTGRFTTVDQDVEIKNVFTSNLPDELSEYNYSIKIPYEFIRHYDGLRGKEELQHGDIVKLAVSMPNPANKNKYEDYNYYFKIKNGFGWSNISTPIFYAYNLKTQGKIINILAPSVATGVQWRFDSDKFSFLSINALVSANISNNASNKPDDEIAQKEIKVLSFAPGAVIDLAGWVVLGYAYDFSNNFNLILVGIRGLLVDRLFGTSE